MAIAKDAVSNSGSKTSVSSYSWSHTCAASAVLAVTLCNEDATNTDGIATAVTYNGVALTQRITEQVQVTASSRYYSAEAWTMPTPASGANTVAITLTGTCTSNLGGAVSFTGGNTTDEYDASASGSHASSGNAVASITTGNANSYIFGILITDEFDTNKITVDAPGTEEWDVDIQGERSSGQTHPTTAVGDYTPSWTLSDSDTGWVVAVVALNEAAAAGSDVKSANAVLQANVKSINGVATANIKSINGIVW